MLKAKNLPLDKRDAFVEAFGKLKQKVLWKYENDSLPQKPDNVMITSWLPQRDVLAHPNVKLFITHGGLLGTTEAIIEGVPLLGIPVYSDQTLNMMKAEEMGYGIKLSYKDLNEEIISKRINEILSRFEYQNNAKKVSKLFKDRPITAAETTVFWVEYVIRNQGASHFKSAAHELNYFQLHLIDSYLFILSILGLILFAIYKSIKITFKTIKKFLVAAKIKNE